ncbi:MAG: hypothetical protein JO316_08400 [Abitibacteriaceae bacterium]|nr:hypothetical protein [Abditibacteriaceae bacterium]MBV9865355.1 hypothetical protein [Abditibacteriaceae bacterium]
MLIRSSASTYSVAAHDDLLQQWQGVRHEPGPLQLDLSSMEFIDPYGMAGLTLFLNHLPPASLPVHLTLQNWPGDEGTASRLYSGSVAYLTRMNFWDAVTPTLDVKPEQLPVRPARVVDRNVLIEITILRTHEAISAMLRKTGEILQNLSYTVPARGHILEVLSELCSNVLLHAQSDFGCVAAMQTYCNRKGTRYIVMGIGDAGIGIRRSLAANPALANRLHSDAQALGVAVQPGASRFATGGHGGGLPRVLEIAKRYNGRVSFRSGTGSMIYHGKEDHRRTFEGPPLAGTQLRISLPEAVMRTERQGDLLTPVI